MVLKVVFTLRVSGDHCTVNYYPGYSLSHVTTFSSLVYFLYTQCAVSLIARMLTLSADILQSYISICSQCLCQQLCHAPTYWLFALYLASALVPALPLAPALPLSRATALVILSAASTPSLASASSPGSTTPSAGEGAEPETTDTMSATAGAAKGSHSGSESESEGTMIAKKKKRKEDKGNR